MELLRAVQAIGGGSLMLPITVHPRSGYFPWVYNWVYRS